MRQCKRCQDALIVGGAAITKYYCRECHKPGMHSSTAIPKLCKECSEELNKCQRCMGDM